MELQAEGDERESCVLCYIPQNKKFSLGESVRVFVFPLASLPLSLSLSLSRRRSIERSWSLYASHDKQRQGKKDRCLFAAGLRKENSIFILIPSFSTLTLMPVISSFSPLTHYRSNSTGPAQLALEAVILAPAVAKRRRRKTPRTEAAAPVEDGDDGRRRNQIDTSSTSSSSFDLLSLLYFFFPAAPPLPARTGVRARPPGRCPDAGAEIRARHRRWELRDEDVSFMFFFPHLF